MLALLTVAVLGSPQGGDWPEYRGPDRTGSVAATKWSPKGADEPLWRANVGAGYSCPSIVAGRLVTMGFDKAAGVDRITCLDAKTGKRLWAHEYAAVDKPQFHEGGTLSTPSIRDGLVYCVNRVGMFHVLSLADGSVRWTRDYGKELDVSKTFHGFSASPLLHGERIFLQCGGLVAALDAGDGRVLWRTKNLGDGSYCNPVMLDVGGSKALATVRGPSFFVLSCTDGSVLYEYGWKLAGGAVHCAEPVPVGNGRVFLSTAYNKGAAMLRLGPDAKVEKLWANKRMRNKVTASVQRDGHLYGFDESMLRCVDLDGKSKWRVRGLGLGSLSMVGDRLLVLSSDGELIVANADPAGFVELSRKKVLDGGEYWSMPVFVDGLIYVRNSRGDLVCLDHRSAVPAQDVASEPAVGERPTPTQLFADHAAAVGREAFEVEGKALRLRGKWAIESGGLAPEPMTWTFVGTRWQQHLDEGGLTYTCNGDSCWAIEPEGTHVVTGDERFEFEQLFPLVELFCPVCPQGATVSGPVRFGDSRCWKVTSDPQGLGRKNHYFDVATGQLRGSDGARRSVVILHGSQRLSGMTLPQRVIRYRAQDGQEHTMTITSAEWIPVDDAFVKPVEIQRLMRTPAELARATKELTKQFENVLGRFKPAKPGTPFRDEEVELAVEKGELWFGPADDRWRVRVEEQKDGKLPVAWFQLEIVKGDTGEATFALINHDGTRIAFARVPKKARK